MLVRHHSPISCVYNFDKIIIPSFSRQIYLYYRGDFQSLSYELTETNWSLVEDNDVDTYVPNVTYRILYLVYKHIPNKLVYI